MELQTANLATVANRLIISKYVDKAHAQMGVQNNLGAAWKGGFLSCYLVMREYQGSISPRTPTKQEKDVQLRPHRHCRRRCHCAPTAAAQELPPPPAHPPPACALRPYVGVRNASIYCRVKPLLSADLVWPAIIAAQAVSTPLTVAFRYATSLIAPRRIT